MRLPAGRRVRAPKRSSRPWLAACIALVRLAVVSGSMLNAPVSGAAATSPPSFDTYLRTRNSNTVIDEPQCGTNDRVDNAEVAYNENTYCQARNRKRIARAQSRSAADRQSTRVLRLTGGALVRRKAQQATTENHVVLPAGTSTHQRLRPSSSTSGAYWPETSRVLKRCLARAGSGGLPGAAAGVLQVVALMWLRTVVNYQCRYGTSMVAAASELYRQGGILRFYRGVSFAIVSNPLSRFGMAAANEGAIALSDMLPRPVSVTFTTWIASLLAAVWRVVLTPLDTCKTVLQVEGSKGFALLMEKVLRGNLGCLYQGATAAAAATAVGYFPWFLTFNYLNGRVKKPSAMGWMVVRNAGIGLASSIASDMCSNSIRVLKTTKQATAAYDAKVTYRGAAALVIEADGWLGLFGRGLSTRILANGLQSMLFTVVWRYLHDRFIVPRREAAELRDGIRGNVVGSAGSEQESSIVRSRQRSTLQRRRGATPGMRGGARTSQDAG